MKKPFLKAGVPNKNNRTYPKEVVERAIDNIKDRIANNTFFVTVHRYPDASHEVDFGDVRGIVKEMTFDGDIAHAEIKILVDVQDGLEIQQRLQNNEMFLVPRGTGQVDENGVVTDYTFISLDLTTDSAFDYEETEGKV